MKISRKVKKTASRKTSIKNSSAKQNALLNTRKQVPGRARNFQYVRKKSQFARLCEKNKKQAKMEEKASNPNLY